MKQRLIKMWILAAMIFSSFTFAGDAPTRISATILDLGEVHKVFLAQGLVSIIQLPYPITEIKLGNPDDVQAQISKTLPSELTLILKRSNVQATNLIVRCGVRTFVFDLLPSRKTHQDLVRISGSYGGPKAANIGAVLIESSRLISQPSNPVSVSEKEMVLIDSSSHSERKP